MIQFTKTLQRRSISNDIDFYVKTEKFNKKEGELKYQQRSLKVMNDDKVK